MHQELFDYFEEKSGLPLTGAEKQAIAQKFTLQKLRRRQYYHSEGDVCRKMCFMLKGSARMFSVDDKGREHIIRFGMEGWWLGDIESYMLEVPTRYNVEMLEDAQLLVVTKPDMEELIATIPAVAQTIKTIDRHSAIATQQRIFTSISQTAEQRLEWLMETYPSFLQRFPQGMIASYLGISPETLSRIRKKMLHP